MPYGQRAGAFVYFGHVSSLVIKKKAYTVYFQLFSLSHEHEDIEPVTGLEFDRMPSDSMTEYQYYILATTPRYVIL